MIFWFKTAEEPTIMSEIWNRQSVMQKWLCRGGVKDGGGRGGIKRNAAVHVVRSA